jgi:flagellar L-ring protein precursor FlgH
MKMWLKLFHKHLPGGIVFSLLVLSTGSSLATSLWDEEVNGGRSLYSDRKAVRRGDLVTIVINLDSKATKDQSTQTSKTVDMLARFQALWGPYWGGVRTAAEQDRRQPHNQWSDAETFNGNGQLKHNESLTSTIQARVTDVMPNNVLRVEAARKVEIDKETSYLVLTGLIRQEDLTTANTVNSSQVADLQLKEVGQGDISRTQRKGWLTRFWETVNPF